MLIKPIVLRKKWNPIDTNVNKIKKSLGTQKSQRGRSSHHRGVKKHNANISADSMLVSWKPHDISIIIIIAENHWQLIRAYLADCNSNNSRNGGIGSSRPDRHRHRHTWFLSNKHTHTGIHSSTRSRSFMCLTHPHLQWILPNFSNQSKTRQRNLKIETG